MMLKLRILVLIITLFAILFPPEVFSEVFQKGEKLHYEISILGVGFASIKIENLGIEKFKGKDCHRVIFLIDTYDGIPFLEAHVKYEGWFDKSVSYSVGFDGYTQLEDKTWELHRINFNYDKKQVKTEKFIHNKLVETVEIDTDKKWCEGVCLFSLIRNYIHLKRNIKVPTMMGNDTASTTLILKGNKEDVEIDAVDYPIKAVYARGLGDWSGVYGVTGRFKSWYSDDDYRIPLKAEMNLYVGTVEIELVKWVRPGWSPPKSDKDD